MSYMQFKIAAILFGLMFFGTSCVNACVTREVAQQQTLNADQQAALVKHVSTIFKDLNNKISWVCFADAIAQFIDEHNVALKNQRFAELATALRKTGGYSTALFVGLELQGFKDFFANDPTTTNGQILDILSKRISFPLRKNTCAQTLVDDLYKHAHPNLCGNKAPSTQENLSSDEEDAIRQMEIAERRRLAAAILADDDDEL